MDGLKRFSQQFDKVCSTISRWTLEFCVVLGIVMAVVIFANVVGRYVIGRSIIWAEELARQLMIMLTFLGGGVALQRGRHVKLGFVLERLPARLAIFITLVCNALIFWFLVIFLQYAVLMVQNQGFRQYTPAMRIPMFYIYIWLVIGGGLMCLQLANIFFKDLLALFAAKPKPTHQLDETTRIM